TATAATQGVGIGQTVAASSLFSVSDADGDAITQYQFFDATQGGGHWSVNGVAQPALTKLIDVSPSDLAGTVYVGGAAAGSELLYARAYDGTAWGEWTNWQEQTQRASNVKSVINAPAQKASERNQWQPLAGFVSVSDADGDPIVRYELKDDTASAGSGYFSV